MKRVLITGGTGFLGRHILSSLSSFEVKQRLVIREESEKKITIPTDSEVIITKNIFTENVHWWRETCKDVDVVIHAAWDMEYGEYANSIKNFSCLEGSLIFAQGAAASGIKRFVGIGTCAEYSSIDSYLSVDTPLKPSNLYASSKVALFNLLDNWLPFQGIDFAWARIFNLYGEGEHPKRLHSYIRKKMLSGEPANLSEGSLVRDYLDVKDAGRELANLALSDKTGPFNICSGKAITIREIAEEIADEYGRRDLLKFNKRSKNQFDAGCIVGIKNL